MTCEWHVNLIRVLWSESSCRSLIRKSVTQICHKPAGRGLLNLCIVLKFGQKICINQPNTIRCLTVGLVCNSFYTHTHTHIFLRSSGLPLRPLLWWRRSPLILDFGAAFKGRGWRRHCLCSPIRGSGYTSTWIRSHVRLVLSYLTNPFSLSPSFWIISFIVQSLFLFLLFKLSIDISPSHAVDRWC